MKKLAACLAIFAAITVVCGPASATQYVYAPVNPTFGGSGLNGAYLLSVGEAQGYGAQSGANATPNLSGLENALSNIGTGTGTGSTGTGSTGSGTTTIIIPSNSIPSKP